MTLSQLLAACDVRLVRHDPRATPPHERRSRSLSSPRPCCRCSRLLTESTMLTCCFATRFLGWSASTVCCPPCTRSSARLGCCPYCGARLILQVLPTVFVDDDIGENLDSATFSAYAFLHRYSWLAFLLAKSHADAPVCLCSCLSYIPCLSRQVVPPRCSAACLMQHRCFSKWSLRTSSCCVPSASSWGASSRRL